MDYSEMEDTPEGMSHKAQNHHTSVSIVSNNKCNLPTLTHPDRKSGTCGIHELRIAYIELYDAVTLINSQFGIPILLQITTSVIVCVTGYYTALGSFNTGDTSVHDFNTYFKQFLTLFLTSVYGAQLAWLIVGCHRGMQEANKGILYIHRITSCPNINYGTLLKLKTLSNQLKDMKVEFTACGFFVLNLTLLGKIICGIFTYILIMVQLE
jgi:gustatory receptor